MRRYGRWAGSDGRPEDVTKCIASVMPKGTFHYYQCSHKRGHGPGGLYCKQHARMKAEGRVVWEEKDKGEIDHETK